MDTPSASECVKPEYYLWLKSASYKCNTSSNEVEDGVYSLSSYMQSQLMVRPSSTMVIEEQNRIFIGCLIVMTNFLLLVFLNSRSAMRKRYIFYTLVSIGDMLDGTYLIYPSIIRIGEMATGTFFEGTTLWGCAKRGNMVFRVYGTELVSLSMLVMAAEKIFAVLFTMTYRLYGTPTTRFMTAAVCLLVCLVSLLTMFVTSYLDSRTEVQDDKYCGVSGSVTEEFAQFHQFFNVSCQIGGFLGSGFAYIAARRLTNQAQSKEIKSIKPILVVSFISCIVTSSSNIIYILKNFLDLDITKSQQNYAVTYSSAVFQVSKFALYILTGKEFRDCLRKMINDKNDLDTTVAKVVVVKTTRLPSDQVNSFHTSSKP